MKADVIRKKFLKFFESKGHKIVASDSLVPKGDPTLLFTGAGMNQFKDYFLAVKKDFKRAASSQKCFRTGDIDNVGKTPGHHTFFEMLGNFSFGDYFKKEAIQWAWEFMTTELKIPQDRMWVSVYEGDDEAFDLWQNLVRLPADKIKKLGDKENFWPSEAKAKGPNGPCGPCSEIYVDDIEVWNLVFTQFNRKEGGMLEPLPMKNIDTGMGLERIAAVMQAVHSNFETDLFVPIVEAIHSVIASSLTSFGVRNDVAVNTIADHVRAVVFLIADGVLPSNEGRGYVERMIIRRAARFGKKLGLDKPFLYKLVPTVTRVMKKPYPGLEARRENISQVLLNEEERFGQTLQEGTRILEEIMADVGARHACPGSASRQARAVPLLQGDVIFKLYDTYGFPYDLTEEIAKEKGFKLDKAGFDKAMAAQKEASRKSSSIAGEIFAETVAHKIKKIAAETKFIGYDTLSCEAEVVAVLEEKDGLWVVLDKTPFYGESGGQVGDTGKIIKIPNPKSQIPIKSQIPNSNTELDVIDTKIFDKITVHICKVEKGSIRVGDKIEAEVDSQRRSDIAKNHTATHLLHAALRKVLGEHVHQSGSLVAPERLRFDFTHFKAVKPGQLERIEEVVNENIQRNDEVSVSDMELKDAVTAGAMALFGEKYEDNVRVVSIAGSSKELCGGTHLDNTGEIGQFKITSESSISAGVRRIEAVTGRFVKDVVEKERLIQQQKATKEQEEKIKLEAAKARRRALLDNIDDIIKRAKLINGIRTIACEVPQADIDDLRSMCDTMKAKEPSVAILLASKLEDKVFFVLALSKALVNKGLDAVKIIKEISKITGGGGGGRSDMAQAGCKDLSKVKEAFRKFEELVAEAKL